MAAAPARRADVAGRVPGRGGRQPRGHDVDARRRARARRDGRAGPPAAAPGRHRRPRPVRRRARPAPGRRPRDRAWPDRRSRRRPGQRRLAPGRRRGQPHARRRAGEARRRRAHDPPAPCRGPRGAAGRARRAPCAARALPAPGRRRVRAGRGGPGGARGRLRRQRRRQRPALPAGRVAARPGAHARERAGRDVAPDPLGRAGRAAQALAVPARRAPAGDVRHRHDARRRRRGRRPRARPSRRCGCSRRPASGSAR